MRIDLTPRLRMVGKLIPAGVRLTDVGTDHAYLPAALIGEGKIPSAIAADLRQGPLARAKETVRQAGLTGKVAFRLCDGLSGIRPDETDAVAIAGMGGETIAAILSAALWTRERGMPLILQPMSSMPELRGWLQANGFCIEEERLAKEGDTLYTALLVRAGEMPPLSPAELWAGKNNSDPLRGEWLDMWIARTGRALEGMARSRGEEVLPRRRALEEVREGLAKMKEEWEVCQQA
ncbi:MAG: SAM-dependent methyltransferase [Lawsonibacter sp.]|nr:SAM-dependent methyltransferase [Lawsonibacter sp.]